MVSMRSPVFFMLLLAVHRIDAFATTGPDEPTGDEPDPNAEMPGETVQLFTGWLGISEAPQGQRRNMQEGTCTDICGMNQDTPEDKKQTHPCAAAVAGMNGGWGPKLEGMYNNVISEWELDQALHKWLCFLQKQSCTYCDDGSDDVEKPNTCAGISWGPNSKGQIADMCGCLVDGIDDEDQVRANAAAQANATFGIDLTAQNAANSEDCANNHWYGGKSNGATQRCMDLGAGSQFGEILLGSDALVKTMFEEAKDMDPSWMIEMRNQFNTDYVYESAWCRTEGCPRVMGISTKGLRDECINSCWMTDGGMNGGNTVCPN